jgi:hypothetical protein
LELEKYKKEEKFKMINNARRFFGWFLAGLGFLVIIFSLMSIFISGENFFVADPVGIDEILEWLRLPHPKILAIIFWFVFSLLGSIVALRDEIENQIKKTKK